MLVGPAITLQYALRVVYFFLQKAAISVNKNKLWQYTIIHLPNYCYEPAYC